MAEKACHAVPCATQVGLTQVLGIEQKKFMFGWLKKKSQEPSGTFLVAQDVLSRTADMLNMQLMLCRADEEAYEKFLRSNFTRGYFFGFFDAALQYAQIPCPSDERFIVLMTAGHTHLFDGNHEKGGDFLLESFAQQNTADFQNAQRIAGEEYFSFLDGKIKNPIFLMKKFHDDNPINA